MAEFRVESGLEFMKLIENHPIYGRYVDSKCKYEVWAAATKLHWFLMIKGEQPDQPFVTIEIKSEKGHDVTPTIRKVIIVNALDDSLPKPEKVGYYETDKTLLDLCAHADDVVRGMMVEGGYNLVTRNCQHFCNELLVRLGLKKYQPTVPESASKNIVVQSVCDFIGGLITTAVPEDKRKSTMSDLNESARLYEPATVYIPA